MSKIEFNMACACVTGDDVRISTIKVIRYDTNIPYAVGLV
jgi:hypothetical protein